MLALAQRLPRDRFEVEFVLLSSALDFPVETTLACRRTSWVYPAAAPSLGATEDRPRRRTVRFIGATTPDRHRRCLAASRGCPRGHDTPVDRAAGPHRWPPEHGWFSPGDEPADAEDRPGRHRSCDVDRGQLRGHPRTCRRAGACGSVEASDDPQRRRDRRDRCPIRSASDFGANGMSVRTTSWSDASATIEPARRSTASSGRSWIARGRASAPPGPDRARTPTCDVPVAHRRSRRGGSRGPRRPRTRRLVALPGVRHLRASVRCRRTARMRSWRRPLRGGPSSRPPRAARRRSSGRPDGHPGAGR